MNASCKINFNSIKNGIKNKVKSMVEKSNLFDINGDVLHVKNEQNVQKIVDNINSAFKEEIIKPYMPDIYRIDEPSLELVQKYVDHFNNQFGLKPVIPKKREKIEVVALEKGQFHNTPEFNKLPYKSEEPTFTYAGIGSRETPKNILEIMKSLGEELESLGYTLNTGDAGGADQAFSSGVNSNKKYISTAKDATTRTLTIAQEIHPVWDKLQERGRKLMARNTNQVFGKDLDTPVDFVLAWTPDGVEDYRFRTVKSGGTGQAIDMASRKGIPVINMANSNWRLKLDDILNEIKPISEYSDSVTIDNNINPNELKELPVFSRRGINTTTKEGTFQHFGSPFRGSVSKGLSSDIDKKTTFSTIKEANKAYKDWILGKKYKKVNPEQRNWIVSKLLSGELIGKTLLYYKPDNVEQLDGTTVSDYNTYVDVLSDLIMNTPISLETKNIPSEGKVSYSDLGDKTQSNFSGIENAGVQIVSDPNSHLDEQKRGEAVVAYRNSKDPVHSFGNPFTEGTTEENVIDFVNWIVEDNKPDVILPIEELFNENPKLANKVYEALGFGQGSINFYEGNITPEPNTIFVFGSNPEGRHGAGAAKIARTQFGAIYGQGEGLQGNAYALPTKDLRVKENKGFKSISPEQITNSIKKLYETAKQNPDKQFKVAYRNTKDTSLNGYTGLEMIEMFNQAGPIPSNVIFSKEWVDTNKLSTERQITPEQKQQAQQLYSQYLDSLKKPTGTINVYWGQAESETSTRILSNLAPRKFMWEGREYGSVEHAYQSNKSGTFDQATYDKYVKAGGYGTKIRGKGRIAEMKAADSLGLMKNLVVESFKQNPNSDAAKKLLQYENFTHNTNELIDKAFLEGLKLAQQELLGSKQDIEGFKKFVKRQPTTFDSTGINSKQREWIRKQLKSGRFKGKPIYYGNTQANKEGVPSHATALDYLINSPNSPFNQNKDLNNTNNKSKINQLFTKYNGTLSEEEFNNLSLEEQQTIIDQQNNC